MTTQPPERSGNATPKLWQERAPHGPWFVRTERDGDIFFGSDQASAIQCLRALHRIPAQQTLTDEQQRALERMAGHDPRDPGLSYDRLELFVESAAQAAKGILSAFPAQQTQWQPINHRPFPSGKYLVGHRGHHEVMHFFGPEKEWVKGTQLGWHRLTDKGWKPDDPVTRFHATHCWLIEGPALPSTESGGGK